MYSMTCRATQSGSCYEIGLPPPCLRTNCQIRWLPNCPELHMVQRKAEISRTHTRLTRLERRAAEAGIDIDGHARPIARDACTEKAEVQDPGPSKSDTRPSTTQPFTSASSHARLASISKNYKNPIHFHTYCSYSYNRVFTE